MLDGLKESLFEPAHRVFFGQDSPIFPSKAACSEPKKLFELIWWSQKRRNLLSGKARFLIRSRRFRVKK